MRAAGRLRLETWGGRPGSEGRRRSAESQRAGAPGDARRPAPPRRALARARGPSARGRASPRPSPAARASAARERLAGLPAAPAQPGLPPLLLLSLLPSRAALTGGLGGESAGTSRDPSKPLRRPDVSCLCALPPGTKTPLLKQRDLGAPCGSPRPTGGCASAVLSCSLFGACVEWEANSLFDW